MTVILKLFSISSCLIAFSNALDVAQSFKDAKIVPDIIPEVPDSLLQVGYADGSIANLGNTLEVSSTAMQPNITWTTDPDILYTLILCDPDGAALPGTDVFTHLLIVNIQGCDIKTGDTIFEYIIPSPVPGSGSHRYVFLLFKQDKKLNDDEVRGLIPERPDERFKKLSEFIKRYGWIGPIAGNFYLCTITELKFIQLNSQDEDDWLQ